MKHIIKLMRLHHGIKSILIFLPLVFSGRLFEPQLFVRAAVGFVAFVLLSSAIYCINDVFDCEKDKQHPTKCRRPVASGAVQKRTAIALAVLLTIISFGFSLAVSSHPAVLLIPLLYFILNISYSLGLKNIPMLDIVILVSGFLLRVLYGSALCGIPVSSWLYLTVISVSFYLGLGKRRGELARNADSARGVLRHYTYEFLDKNMYISNALFLIFYSLWCTTSDTASRFHGSLIWTVPLVMLISMRYSFNVESSGDGDPVEVMVHDKPLVALTVIYASVVLAVLYL